MNNGYTFRESKTNLLREEQTPSFNSRPPLSRKANNMSQNMLHKNSGKTWQYTHTPYDSPPDCIDEEGEFYKHHQ